MGDSLASAQSWSNYENVNSDPRTPRETGAYLELTVGRFRCALRADCVLGVVTGQGVDRTIQFRDSKLPFLDLRRRFLGTQSVSVPFAVALEAAGVVLALGVDHVGHVRREALELVTMPRFGLEHPGLFALALRSSGDLLPVLDPMQLVLLGGAD